jgi:hypothetical protein
MPGFPAWAKCLTWPPFAIGNENDMICLFFRLKRADLDVGCALDAAQRLSGLRFFYAGSR